MLFKHFCLIVQSLGVLWLWELTCVPICSETTALSGLHSEQGEGLWGISPWDQAELCRRGPTTHRLFLSSGLPVNLPTGKCSAPLTEVVLQGGGGRVLLPEALKVTFYFRVLCLYLYHFHQHYAQNCVCVSVWGIFRDAKSSLFPRSVQFNREIHIKLTNNYNAN